MIHYQGTHAMLPSVCQSWLACAPGLHPVMKTIGYKETSNNTLQSCETREQDKQREIARKKTSRDNKGDGMVMINGKTKKCAFGFRA